VALSGARPIQRTKGNRHSGSTVDASLRVGARNLNVIKIAEKKHLEDSMSQEPEAGGNVEMCRISCPSHHGMLGAPRYHPGRR
jgi:hypothetical protein